MASPLIADGGGVGTETRIRYELEEGSMSQHDDQARPFSGRNFNDDDGDGDGINSNPCPTNGRCSPFLNGGKARDSYSAEGGMAEDLADGRQGEDHQHMDDTHKDGLGGGRGVDGNDYDDEVGGNWAALQQTYNDSPPIPGATQSDPTGGGAGAGGGGNRRFSRHRSPHQDDDDRQTHRDPPDTMGRATAQEAEGEAAVVGTAGGGDGETQRHSPSNQQPSGFKQQQQQQQQRQQQHRPGLLSGSRRPFRPDFREACNSDDEGEDAASSRDGGRGGEESAGSPSRFDPGGGGQSGASAFSESDADDASNGHADPWASSKSGQGKSAREEAEGEDEDYTEEGGAEGQAQKRQRQQRRKHSELLVGNSFSAIARCYAAANHAIRGIEADQRNMLEAETEIREDLVAFGVRVKEATHLMQMQINAAFTEDSLGASGT